MREDIRMYGVLSESTDMDGNVYSPIEKIWSEVEPFLKKAIERSAPDKYTSDDVFKSLMSREMQLWVAFDRRGLCAIEVTQIIRYPRKKVLMLIFTAGRTARNWLHLIENIKQFAIKNGCVTEGKPNIEGFGRDGWKVMAKPLGFKPVSTLYQYQ